MFYPLCPLRVHFIVAGPIPVMRTRKVFKKPDKVRLFSYLSTLTPKWGGVLFKYGFVGRSG